MSSAPEPITVTIDDAYTVSGLLLRPASSRACYLFAHGAGAGMAHPFMKAIATDLADADIATLRYQFPYMEHRARRPDPPKLAQATVAAAAAEAGRRARALPLIAGGKSFGGRMTSQAQAVSPLPGVRGLAFLGFPLHPAKRPSDQRAKHLFDVRIPMLFLQGTRDDLADMELMSRTIKHLGERASLHLVDGADHSFRVPARSGRTDADVRREIRDAFVAWTLSVIAQRD
jgi:predicted alpha/beta-hydrolase family hydrolase